MFTQVVKRPMRQLVPPLLRRLLRPLKHQLPLPLNRLQQRIQQFDGTRHVPKLTRKVVPVRLKRQPLQHQHPPLPNPLRVHQVHIRPKLEPQRRHLVKRRGHGAVLRPHQKLKQMVDYVNAPRHPLLLPKHLRLKPVPPYFLNANTKVRRSLPIPSDFFPTSTARQRQRQTERKAKSPTE